MKKKIDPAFRNRQKLDRLAANAFPSKQARANLSKAAEEIKQSLPDYPAEHKAELGRTAKQSDIDSHVRSLLGDRRARADFTAISKAKNKPLKEYYKKRLTEDSLNETSARVRKLDEAIRGDTTSRQTQTRMRRVRGLDPKRTQGVTPQDHASLDMLDPLNRIRQRDRNRELRAGSIDTTFARTKAQQRALDKVFKAEFGIPKY